MEQGQQTYRFLLLYALAAAGGAMAYVPFLTILLPMRVTDLGGSSDIEWLAYLTFAGAMTASLANILFGWLSDITHNRKYWIVAGMLSSSLLLAAMSRAQTIEMMIALVVLWQLALNMMLSPLAAWAGDCVPDSQKGLLGGLLSFSPALGALTAALITFPGMASQDMRLFIVAVLVILCVLPAILFGAPREFPDLMPGPVAASAQQDSTGHINAVARSTVLRMWLARLLIQISEAALFAYLYFWFRSIDSSITDSNVARIFSFILAGAIPIALVVGRWADRSNRPILPLPISAAMAGLGLLAMAASNSVESAIAGYILFGVTSAVFLALHTSQTLRVLPKPERRGRDLGIFNLTNTGPSLIVPWLTLALVPLFGFSGLFLLLAGLAFLACLLLLRLPHFR